MTATESELLKYYGSPWDLGEANDEWNDAQRTKIAAFAAEHDNRCMLGNINLHGETGHRLVMWNCYPGDNVYNFGCAFAVPWYDKILRDLIVTRDQAQYTGTSQDIKLIDAIFERIVELGGITLLWT